MKIAVTADLHLTTRKKHPERFHALENILDQLVEQDVNTLIIAGDLFDASCKTPGEFENIIKKKKYSKIELYIIPGNHDPVLAEGTFSLQNIKYFTKPQLIQFSDTIPFIFIPYMPGSSVGEILAENHFPVEPGEWVLVSHGDWLSGTAQKNQYEKGTYMPLTGRDVLLYQPMKAFMGHIHARLDSPIVHYPGSPCGIDPTETGYRSFLVIDTHSWQTTRCPVDTEYLFFNEQITVLPLEDETSYIQALLSNRIKAWNVAPNHQSKVRIRVKARGYSTDRHGVAEVIRDTLKDFQFVDSDQPDVSEVKVSNDLMQGKIAENVKKKIDALEINPKPCEPDRDDILLAALNTIYGEK